ncbi:MAG: DUF4468 domain-containing protein [Spirochaetaceae bacterium]|nr:DUF4468 domain-containing protein [Spirochaetia bacterium]MCF7951880.1 DUF4468 domain-containing protein [Spirochaetaceae bacterium]
MKKMITIMVMFVLLAGCASLETVPSEEREFQKVYSVDGTVEEIYNSTLQWVAENTKENVIQYKSKDEGKIIIQTAIEVTYTVTPVLTDFTLKIEIKENKVRVTAYNFEFSQQSNSWVKIDKRNQFNAIEKKLMPILRELPAYIESDSEW